MAVIVQTEFGRMRRAGGAPTGWLFECPGCGEWLPISEDMLHGRISVDHAFDGCSGGYHETHDFATALTAAPLDLESYGLASSPTEPSRDA